MNLLKSKYHEGRWDNMEVVAVPINKLWASVPIAEVHGGKQFYKPLVKDIEANGLTFPLLVVRATEQQLLEQKKKYKDKILELPTLTEDTQLVVWGGSNRIRAAEELGYTHIDCVIFEDGDFITAHKKQALHRAPYKNILY